MSKKETRFCQKCVKTFQALSSEIRRGGAKYCSVTCYRASRIGRIFSQETRAKISAANMGRSISMEVRAKISRTLAGRDLGGHRKICVTCGVSFRCNPSDKTVNCSQACSSKYFSQFSGPRSHSWKGGLTPSHLKDRRGIQYKAWRTAVFQRDDYTCQVCAKRGGKLEADHLMHFALHPDLRFEVLNGQTLCKSCHQVKTVADRALIRTHHMEVNLYAN